MAEFEERKKIWNIFYSPIVFIVLLVVFVLLSQAVWKVYNHEQISAQDRQRVENELTETNRRQAVLKDQVAALRTPQGIDDEIRSKFNVTKAGEGVAVIVSTSNPTSSASTSTVENTWWQKFGGFFGL